MTFSEDKNHQYYVLRHLYNVLEADNNIEAIMEKLQIYRPRMSMIFEVSQPVTTMCSCFSFIPAYIRGTYIGLEISM